MKSEFKELSSLMEGEQYNVKDPLHILQRQVWHRIAVVHNAKGLGFEISFEVVIEILHRIQSQREGEVITG